MILSGRQRVEEALYQLGPLTIEQIRAATGNVFPKNRVTWLITASKSVEVHHKKRGATTYTLTQQYREERAELEQAIDTLEF